MKISVICPACKKPDEKWKMKMQGSAFDPSFFHKSKKLTDAGRVAKTKGRTPTPDQIRTRYDKIKRPAAYRLEFRCKNPACLFRFGIVGRGHADTAATVPAAVKRMADRMRGKNAL